MKNLVRFVKRVLGNLQVKILLLILVFLFTPVILLFNNYFTHTENIITENTSNLIMKKLEYVSEKLENICHDMVILSNIILNDETILDNLSVNQSYNNFQMTDPESYKVNDLARISRVENQINSIKRNVFFNKNASAQVIIVGADGNMYFSINSYEEEYKIKHSIIKFLSQDWFKIMKSGDRKALWEVPYSYAIDGVDTKRHISLVKTIRNKYSPNDIAGMLMINISEDDIGDAVGDSINGDFALISESNRIIYCSNKNLEDKILKNGDITSRNLYYGSGRLLTNICDERFMVNFFSIYRFGLCAVSFTPYNEITREIDSLQCKISSMNIIIFIVLLLLGTLFILNTVKPIKQLLKRMKKMKVGAYSVGINEVENLDDVNGLVHSFDNMINRVEELVEIVVEEQKHENDLRYEALRAQINPHFLFNTLNTIKWAAKMSGADNVSKMISALGRLLEVSIDKGEELITVNEELELIKCYIYIQNARFNDKFELLIHVNDKNIYSYKILKFTLQPIVENSIIHGFEDKDQDCKIVINIHTERDSLIIDVIDNGIGMTKDKADYLLHKNMKHKFNGIGLNNVHERIRLKYGSDYGLNITSEVKRGTKVSITIPKINEVQEEATS